MRTSLMFYKKDGNDTVRQLICMIGCGAKPLTTREALISAMNE